MTTDKTKRIRRNHSQALKAQILSECAVPGVSVAKVAMAHGINANIVHGWRKAARAQPPVALPPATSCVAGFIPLAAYKLCAPSSDAFIRYGDALRGHHLLHVSEAELKSKVQPYAMADDFWRKVMAAI